MGNDWCCKPKAHCGKWWRGSGYSEAVDNILDSSCGCLRRSYIGREGRGRVNDQYTPTIEELKAVLLQECGDINSGLQAEEFSSVVPFPSLVGRMATAEGLP